MTKRRIYIISTILILGIFITGITFSYLNATSDTKTNEFHPGVLNAPIEEEFEDPGENDNTKKEVWVKNTNNPHEVDAYIRVMLVPTFRDDEGNSLAGNMNLEPSANKVIIDGPNGGKATLKLPNDWSNNWIYINGYFYHKAIVPPGESTALILEKVEVSHNELWGNFQLEVLSDAIQAEMKAAEAVWTDIKIVDGKLKAK